MLLGDEVHYYILYMYVYERERCIMPLTINSLLPGIVMYRKTLTLKKFADLVVISLNNLGNLIHVFLLLFFHSIKNENMIM